MVPSGGRGFDRHLTGFVLLILIVGFALYVIVSSLDRVLSTGAHIPISARCRRRCERTLLALFAMPSP